jgi:hypothetical protein
VDFEGESEKATRTCLPDRSRALHFFDSQAGMLHIFGQQVYGLCPRAASLASKLM